MLLPLSFHSISYIFKCILYSKWFANTRDFVHFKHNYLSRLKENLSITFSGAAGLVSPMKALDGRDVNLIPPDRFLLGGPLMLRGFAHKSIEHSQSNQLNNISENIARRSDDCYLGGRAFWRACAQIYFPMPYLRRKNTWVAENLKGTFFIIFFPQTY